MTTCSCIVIDHPAGLAWAAMTPDRTCPQHTHGQPWQAETRGEA